MIRKIIGSIFLILIVVFLVIAIFIWWKYKPAVIVLVNGDIYVGELKEYFNKIVLKEPWLLQTQFNPQNNQPQRVLVRWSTTVWEPKDYLVFNKNQILFWGYIKKEGNLWQGLERNKSLGVLLLQTTQPQTIQSATSSGQ